MKTHGELIEYYNLHKEMFVNADPESKEEAINLGKLSTLQWLFPYIPFDAEYKKWKEARKCLKNSPSTQAPIID